ncbi:unnamed protein product, partial [Discosporangium mesarthrocarpum]
MAVDGENEGDAACREELEETKAALEALQTNFDDFQVSSRELEEELEAELGRAQEQISELTNATADLASRLADQQAKTRTLGSEVATLQAENARLRQGVAQTSADKAALEQAVDELEEHCRGARAAEEDLRHKLDLAIEERIFVANDLEDLRVDSAMTEQSLRVEVQDLRQELGRLGVGRVIAAKSPHTPRLSIDGGGGGVRASPTALHSHLRSHSFQGAESGAGAAKPGSGSVAPSSGAGRGEGGGIG